ncbi:MAG: PIG-L family deacetylase [Ktedonobacterales bacterium]
MSDSPASPRLLAVLAHPDDESLGFGGVLAKYAAEGIATSLITATRGERGWPGDPRLNPGPAALGRMREGELRVAVRVLGLGHLCLLDYCDGELDQAPPAEAIGQIVAEMRRIRPAVVLTFDPQGAYGHPDHIAICQFTTAAVLAAADASAPYARDLEPHRIAKLYYLATPQDMAEAYQAVFGELTMQVDGAHRHLSVWPEWAITSRIDTTPYWRQVWEAILCHRTQLPGYTALADVTEERHRSLWGTQSFYRALSLVNGGRAQEHDLFAGLR